MRSGAGQRGRLAQRGGQVHRVRRREDGHDLDRQGRQSDQHHGLHEAAGRDLCPVARTGHRGGQDEGTDEVRDDAFRQRAGLERFGDPAFPRADCQRRSGNGDASRHHAFLHDDSGGVPSGDGGRDDDHGYADLRIRHGQVGQDRRPGPPHDRAGRSGGGQGHQDRIYGTASGREALRGGALQYGEHAADVA